MYSVLLGLGNKPLLDYQDTMSLSITLTPTDLSVANPLIQWQYRTPQAKLVALRYRDHTMPVFHSRRDDAGQTVVLSTPSTPTPLSYWAAPAAIAPE